MSPVFVSAADLAPGAVLGAEEEALWRLGGAYELWWVEGRETIRLHLVSLQAGGPAYVRAVGEARRHLLHEVARAWGDPDAPPVPYRIVQQGILRRATVLDLEGLPGYPGGLSASSPRRAGLHALGKPRGKRKPTGRRGPWRSAARG